MNKRKIIFLKILYVFYVLLATISVAINNPYNFYYILGQIFAVVALSLFSLQILLSSRLKILERGIGLGKIMEWHFLNARLALVLVIFHPVLVFFMPYLKLGLSFSEILKLYAPAHFVGLTSLFIILITIILAIYSDALRFKYETWKWIHRFTYFAIILGFVHGYLLSSNLAFPLTLWLAFVFLIGIFGLIYRHFILEYKIRNNVQKIINVKKENHNVYTITITKPTGFNFKAGQFAFLQFLSQSVPKEEHHFTISSSPKNRYLSFTIKNLGDFTSQIRKLKPNENVLVDGPYGISILQDALSEDMLFITGGIGITPIYSILKSMPKNHKRKVMLLYSNKTKKDIVFEKQIKKISKLGWLKAAFFLTREKTPGYQTRINKNSLKTALKELKNPIVFVTGSPKMVSTIEKTLINYKRLYKEIVVDKFSLK